MSWGRTGVLGIGVTLTAIGCGSDQATLGGATCGDGVCNWWEDEASCPNDCPAVCGNGLCGVGEQESCPEDCCVGDGCGHQCGNQVCEQGEDPASCPQDCCRASVDIGPVTGASPECSDCVRTRCCLSDESYLAYQNEERLGDLTYCAMLVCAEKCDPQMCSCWSLGYTLFTACSECMNVHCCSEESACDADTLTCINTCLFGTPTENPACCAEGALFRALDDCQQTNCAAECRGSSCAGQGLPAVAYGRYQCH